MTKINMSFSKGTLNKLLLSDFIEKTDKKILFTYGFKYRNPTTLKVEISKKEAISIVVKESLLDAVEYDDYLDLNAFSGKDMW